MIIFFTIPTALIFILLILAFILGAIVAKIFLWVIPFIVIAMFIGDIMFRIIRVQKQILVKYIVVNSICLVADIVNLFCYYQLASGLLSEIFKTRDAFIMGFQAIFNLGFALFFSVLSMMSLMHTLRGGLEMRARSVVFGYIFALAVVFFYSVVLFS